MMGLYPGGGLKTGGSLKVGFYGSCSNMCEPKDSVVDFLRMKAA